MVPFQGQVYRHVSPGISPVSGAGARSFGGRWNPPDSFPVIYTALSEATARAEFERLAARQGRLVSDFLPRNLYTLDVELSAVLDLTGLGGLRRVGLSMRAVRGDDASACQAVGDAAHKLGFEGIIAPSATSSGPVLAIFELNLRAESIVKPGEYAVWPD